MTIGNDYVISIGDTQQVKGQVSTAMLKESLNFQEESVGKLLTALSEVGIGQKIDVVV